MTNFPYTQVPGKLQNLLEKIRKGGVPARASTKWLKELGYSSSNDGSLLPVLKFVGLTDQSGTPSERWKRYRGNPQMALAEGIMEGYKELFAIHPEAQTLSDEDLDSYFSTHSSGGEQVISKTISTFKNLCALAKFSKADDSVAHAQHEPAKAEPHRASAAPSLTQRLPGNMELHIDIQIHIAPGTTAEQIEQIFASMSKHLYRHNQNG